MWDATNGRPLVNDDKMMRIVRSLLLGRFWSLITTVIKSCVKARVLLTNPDHCPIPAHPMAFAQHLCWYYKAKWVCCTTPWQKCTVLNSYRTATGRERITTGIEGYRSMLSDTSIASLKECIVQHCWRSVLCHIIQHSNAEGGLITHFIVCFITRVPKYFAFVSVSHLSLKVL